MQAIVVAVGVLIDAEGRVLVARRAPDAHQGSLWEFPGGKVEAHESVGDALKRELEEELGIQVEGSEPLMAIEHDYGDKHVRLDVHRVMRWQGEPRGLEGQPLAGNFQQISVSGLSLTPTRRFWPGSARVSTRWRVPAAFGAGLHRADTAHQVNHCC